MSGGYLQRLARGVRWPARRVAGGAWCPRTAVGAGSGRARRAGPEVRGLPLRAPQRMIQAGMRILTEFALHGGYQRRCGGTQQLTRRAPFHDVLRAYNAICTPQLRSTSQLLRPPMRYITRWRHG